MDEDLTRRLVGLMGRSSLAWATFHAPPEVTMLRLRGSVQGTAGHDMPLGGV